MPDLTRRRAPNRHDCWHVLYGDVRVGTIAKRVGIPRDQPVWGWSAASIPGQSPESIPTAQQGRSNPLSVLHRKAGKNPAFFDAAQIQALLDRHRVALQAGKPLGHRVADEDDF
jgi:hypothetical protein